MPYKSNPSVAEGGERRAQPLTMIIEEYNEPVRLNPYNFVEWDRADLVEYIFGHVDFMSRVQCVGVCKRWREYLIERCNSMWQTVQIKTHPSKVARYEKEGRTLFDAGLLNWLALVPPEKIIHFKLEGTGDDAVTIFDVLAARNWVNLQTLKVRRNHPREDSKGKQPAKPYYASYMSFWETINAAKNTLKTLEAIDVELPMDDDTWDLVFGSCTHLQNLVVHFEPTNPPEKYEDELDFNCMYVKGAGDDHEYRDFPLERLQWSTGYKLPDELLDHCPVLDYRRIDEELEDTSDIE